MSNKKTRYAAVVLSALLFSANSLAQVYVGGTVGQARWETNCSQASFCDTYDTSFSILGGYHFNANWGTEMSYTSLGTIHASNYTGAGLETASVKGNNIELAGVYRRQIIEKITGFAKLGVAYNQAKTSGTVNGFIANGTMNSTKPMLGFGITYAINQQIALRAEMSSRKVEMTSSTSTNVNNFSLGLQAGF